MQYAITINSNTISKNIEPSSPACRLEYGESLTSLRTLGKIERLVYEIGKQGRCHVHATLRCDGPLTKEAFKKAMYKPGYFSWFERIRDIGAYNTYIGKDQPKSLQKTCMINIKLV